MTKQIFYLELNKAKAEQLMWYFTEIEQTDFYYGDKRWFDKRHKEMKKCLTNMLKNFNHTV